MTEEIIIDGINVAGCEFYFKDKKYSCDLSFINQEELCKCDDVQDCTYKQLKQAENTVNECHKYLAELEDKIDRLEQENKLLTQQLDENCLRVSTLATENIKLEQENKELKEVKEQLKKWNDENLKRQNDMQKWIDLAEEQRKNYRSTLEEIRTYLDTLSSVDSDFTNTETYLRIQDKINECLGE